MSDPKTLNLDEEMQWHRCNLSNVLNAVDGQRQSTGNHVGVTNGLYLVDIVVLNNRIEHSV